MPRKITKLTPMERFPNRTLCVNLRKGLACSRAIYCASYIQRKEARELRDYEH